MADWFTGIDLESVPEEKSGNFEPLPQGNYSIAIEEIEMKPTKAGGKMISLKTKVVSGDFKGRFVWDNWNIVNASPTAQEMGIGRMKRVFKLIGVDDIKKSNPNDLKGKNFTVFVTNKIKDGRERNNVASWDMPSNEYVPEGKDVKKEDMPSWV